jgi:DNA uptake protein ComE-like DNA-binding protein
MNIRRAAGRQPSELSSFPNRPGVVADVTARRADLLPLADDSRRGVVLIVVLVLVMMVALAGFGFLSAMSTEYEGARLNGSMRQAQQTMASAESTLLWFAALSERERMLLGGTFHNPALFRGHLVEPLKEPGTGTASTPLSTTPLMEQPISTDPAFVDDRWRFSVVSLDRTPEQNSVLRFGLQSESSKLNPSTLMKWEQTSPGAGRTSLMQLPGMTEAIADAILDWLDADDQTREFGAETEYYQTLDRPYRAANAVPKQLNELLFVKGVTRPLLMGISPGSDPTNQSSQTLTPSIDTNGDLSSNPSATIGAGWIDHLTLHSAERNRNRQGQPRISLNSTGLTELEQQLTAVLPENLARYILLARVYGLTLSTEPVAGAEPSAAPYASTMVAAFPIASLADLINSTIQVSSATGPIVVQSPLQSSSPEFATLAASLFDLATVNPESVVYGRINLQTASETVLRTIPGLTPELVTQIITQRATLDPAETGTVAWLLSRNVLDPVLFRRVFPELTMGGDVFQCDVIVHRTIGGPMLRRNLILDAASTPPRRVYWAEQTDSPLPYSQKLLLPRVQ